MPGGDGFGRKFVGKWEKLVDFVEGKVDMDGSMLDPLETKQIHGSNPTKPHQTNKSQKNWGYFWWGIFEIGEEHNKLG